jgi:hypothetical protein
MFIESSGAGNLPLTRVSDIPYFWISADSSYFYLNAQSLTLGRYTSLSDLKTALTGIVQTVGYPLVTVGDVTSFTSGSAMVVIDLTKVTSVSDGTTGVVLNGAPTTLGYAPYSSYADFKVGLFDLLGYINVHS